MAKRVIFLEADYLFIDNTLRTHLMHPTMFANTYSFQTLMKKYTYTKQIYFQTLCHQIRKRENINFEIQAISIVWLACLINIFYLCAWRVHQVFETGRTPLEFWLFLIETNINFLRCTSLVIRRIISDCFSSKQDQISATLTLSVMDHS